MIAIARRIRPFLRVGVQAAGYEEKPQAADYRKAAVEFSMPVLGDEQRTVRDASAFPALAP
jgi:hypothetical protein